MGLLDYQSDYTGKVAEKTQRLLRQTLMGATNLYDFVWHNPDLTPAQAATALDVDGPILFSMASDLQALLNKYSPGIADGLNVPSDYTVAVKNGIVVIAPVSDTVSGS